MADYHPCVSLGLISPMIALGDLGAKLQLAAPQKEHSQGPDSTAGISYSTAGISDSTAGISPVKKSPSGTFWQTSYAECHPKLFSPSGRTESTAGISDSTTGIFPPRTVCPALPLVRRCSSVGFPEPQRHLVRLTGGPWYALVAHAQWQIAIPVSPLG